MRNAPTVFLSPISLALVVDRAVDRLMKLMQAISKMNTAAAEKM